MRIAVHGASVRRAGARLVLAVAGLALRGHDVRWVGSDPPQAEGLLAVRSTRELAGWRAQVVIGGGAPLWPAVLGWRTGANAMLLGADAKDLAGWGLLQRWAWDSLYTMALVAESDADAARSHAKELPLERFALWSGADDPSEPDATHPDTELLERAGERALSRHLMHGPRSALFVDRDGTLVIERGYLADANDIELLPGVADALREVQAAGHPVVVVSNQSGVGRGLFPLSRVYEAMARLRRELRMHGVELDAVFFCPHRPGAGCACRKPGIELLQRAAEDLRLSLKHSVMAGDKRLDAATGHAAGGKGLLVRTGYGRDEETRIGDEEFPVLPDAVCDGLPEVARWFLARQDIDG